MTKSKFTMKGFYKFCKSKDPLKEIDNEYWSTCALGLYMKSISEPFPENDIGYFADHLNSLPAELYYRLEEGKFYKFGELVGYIEKEYPDLI